MKRKRPVPDLHFVMIVIATIVLVVCLILHYFLPADATFIGLITLVAGFLFGKFSNGFKTTDSNKKETSNDTSD